MDAQVQGPSLMNLSEVWWEGPEICYQETCVLNLAQPLESSV